MNLISANIANLETTHTPEGGPYRKQKLNCEHQRCRLEKSSEVRWVYAPNHPDASRLGIVLYPDIDLRQEMRDMLDANRTYEDAAADCAKEITSFESQAYL